MGRKQLTEGYCMQYSTVSLTIFKLLSLHDDCIESGADADAAAAGSMGMIGACNTAQDSSPNLAPVLKSGLHACNARIHASLITTDMWQKA